MSGIQPVLFQEPARFDLNRASDTLASLERVVVATNLGEIAANVEELRRTVLLLNTYHNLCRTIRKQINAFQTDESTVNDLTQQLRSMLSEPSSSQGQADMSSSLELLEQTEKTKAAAETRLTVNAEREGVEDSSSVMNKKIHLVHIEMQGKRVTIDILNKQFEELCSSYREKGSSHVSAQSQGASPLSTVRTVITGSRRTSPRTSLFSTLQGKSVSSDFSSPPLYVNRSKPGSVYSSPAKKMRNVSSNSNLMNLSSISPLAKKRIIPSASGLLITPPITPNPSTCHYSTQSKLVGLSFYSPPSSANRITDRSKPGSGIPSPLSKIRSQTSTPNPWSLPSSFFSSSSPKHGSDYSFSSSASIQGYSSSMSPLYRNLDSTESESNSQNPALKITTRVVKSHSHDFFALEEASSTFVEEGYDSDGYEEGERKERVRGDLGKRLLKLKRADSFDEDFGVTVSEQDVSIHIDVIHLLAKEISSTEFNFSDFVNKLKYTFTHVQKIVSKIKMEHPLFLETLVQEDVTIRRELVKILADLAFIKETAQAIIDSSTLRLQPEQIREVEDNCALLTFVIKEIKKIIDNGEVIWPYIETLHKTAALIRTNSPIVYQEAGFMKEIVMVLSSAQSIQSILSTNDPIYFENELMDKIALRDELEIVTRDLKCIAKAVKVILNKMDTSDKEMNQIAISIQNFIQVIDEVIKPVRIEINSAFCYAFPAELVELIIRYVGMHWG